jgi:putative acetyltransferase
MTIAIEFPDQPEVIALIAELDAYQDTLYPPESRHALDLTALKQPNVLFAVARDNAGRAIGCGAIVLYPEFGEIKRMYVSPHGRGRGVAKKLLALLGSQAIASGCKLLKLETGPYQHEALALYASAGYERRGPFGDYTNDPLSVFMQIHAETLLSPPLGFVSKFHCRIADIRGRQVGGREESFTDGPGFLSRDDRSRETHAADFNPPSR